MAKPHIALITGATGFIGSNLVRRMVSDGWEVHIIVRPNSDLAILGSCVDKTGVHTYDGSTSDLIEIVKTTSPDIVIHLASLFLAQHTTDDVLSLIQSNILFASQLLEAMDANGVRIIINTGTAWQHYEDADYNPVCLYAATKQAFEAILEFYVEARDFSAITLQLNDTYGPMDPRSKLFSLLRKAGRSQEALQMSAGEQLIDIVYIDDVIAAFLLAAGRLVNANSKAHAIYSVTSSRPIKLKDLVEKYRKITGSTLAVEWGARPYRPREVMVPWSRGQTLPHWVATTPLDEGIALMESCTDVKKQ